MNDLRYDRMERRRQRMMHRRGGDKRWFGVALLIVGVLMLLKKFDVFFFTWHAMWPWVLIGIGLFLGIKSKFQNKASWVLLLIGTLHVIPVFTIWGVRSSALAGPIGLIFIGVMIIFFSSKKKRWSNRCEDNITTVTNEEGVLNIDVTFGGHKEVVTSKNFKGGNVSTTFGGTEINLMNAATTEKVVVMNLSVSFGGIEIIVPSHWEIKNEISNTLGSVEDKRYVHTLGGNQDDKVTLVLRGSCSFSHVEIKSY